METIHPACLACTWCWDDPSMMEVMGGIYHCCVQGHFPRYGGIGCSYKEHKRKEEIVDKVVVTLDQIELEFRVHDIETGNCYGVVAVNHGGEAEFEMEPYVVSRKDGGEYQITDKELAMIYKAMERFKELFLSDVKCGKTRKNYPMLNKPPDSEGLSDSYEAGENPLTKQASTPDPPAKGTKGEVPQQSTDSDTPVEESNSGSPSGLTSEELSKAVLKVFHIDDAYHQGKPPFICKHCGEAHDKAFILCPNCRRPTKRCLKYLRESVGE